MITKGYEYTKEWIPIQMKEPGKKQRCYAIFKTKDDKYYQTIATFIPQYSIRVEDYFNDLSDDYEMEINPNDDEEYVPRGFYEDCEYCETSYRITDQNFYWRSLLPMPLEII